MPPDDELPRDAAITLLADGREVGTDELVPLVYDNLRRLADAFLRRESEGHTLQPTALVHEAYLKLADQRQGWANRAHFLAVAGNAMRRVLVDAARARGSQKRGGALRRVTLLDDEAEGERIELDILELDEALQRLAAVKERYVQIVEMHFFSGLTLREVGEVLGIARSTVALEWAQARAWLAVELDLAAGS